MTAARAVRPVARPDDLPTPVPAPFRYGKSMIFMDQTGIRELVDNGSGVRYASEEV